MERNKVLKKSILKCRFAVKVVIRRPFPRNIYKINKLFAG